MIVNRTMLQVARLNSICVRPFSSLNLGSITKDEVVSSGDSKWMGQLCRQVCEANDSQHADAIDEYFRKNFRKLSVRQALDVLEPLGDKDFQARALGDKFWMWESLDEAIRASVDELNDDEYDKAFNAFANNLKGSDELMDMFEQRMHRQQSASLFK